MAADERRLQLTLALSHTEHPEQWAHMEGARLYFYNETPNLPLKRNDLEEMIVPFMAEEPFADVLSGEIARIVCLNLLVNVINLWLEGTLEG